MKEFVCTNIQAYMPRKKLMYLKRVFSLKRDSMEIFLMKGLCDSIFCKITKMSMKYLKWVCNYMLLASRYKGWMMVTI